MFELTRRRFIGILVALLVLVGVVYGFWPSPVMVQVSTVARDSLQVTLEEDGKTRVQNRYEISSPVAAYARRIEVEAGDSVARGEPLVRLEAPRSSLLDIRSRAEAEARVAAARAQVQQAERRVDGAEAEAARAREERKRLENLVQQGSATRQALERAVADARQAEANLEAARAAVTTARAELARARSALEADPSIDDERSVQAVLRAPTSGRILAVHRRSAGQVGSGEGLVEVGNTNLLEVHVDVLSQDALRIEPGIRVDLDEWGGDRVLEGIVDRVEPQAETDVSALGVEEQRVTVVVRILSPHSVWRDLGSGYRMLARFILWEGSDVLQLPTSALFRLNGGWGVFVVDGGEARRRRVKVGHQSGLTAEILSGLEEGDRVIVHPDNDVEAGVRVESHASD